MTVKWMGVKKSLFFNLPSCYGDVFNDVVEYGYRERLMDRFELDRVSKVIGYHPSYLEHFLNIQNFIMCGDGPLPFVYRHYLAIMAAARHKCTYLINLHTKEFLEQGGERAWLNGLDFIPPKLRSIYTINKILAHRPWLLKKEHIEELTTGTNNWSLSEVVHAIVLLSHFHSLSSFVFSCGLTQELENTSSQSNRSAVPQQHVEKTEEPAQIPQLPEIEVSHPLSSSPKDSHSKLDATIDLGVDALMARMKNLSERSPECNEAELSNRFKSVEQQAVELSATKAESIAEVPQNISHLIDDPTFTYQDFQRRGAAVSIPTFRIQDYSWDDHGYSLVNRLYSDVGNLLDVKFRAAYNLTYFTMADRKNVDTSKFRRAIWNYIQCIYGIRYDDYDYGEVNQLLERSLKMFIKTACCFPERITKQEYDSILNQLQHSEKVHVNLMILEARNQAELLYALREIMRYMT
ncbi:Sestrin like [Pseudolycoriella hygida]|uniref:Sestrin like n=1 Tax=Pseudolycoriella hygida TaxID=35572 RepID=A0A9Q0S3Z7_9DIPT|nr:Sestrin like [Pseudolycoriella hygida]